MPFCDFNTKEMCYKILDGFDEVDFHNFSRYARKFIIHLCKIKPSERLGCLEEGIDDIRNHM